MFQEKSRTNLAKVITNAMSHRIKFTGVRTADDQDETGDADAWRMVRRTKLQVVMADAIQTAFDLSESYVIVGFDPKAKLPVVTEESPFECVTINDPMTGEELAGLKVIHDEVNDEDLAYLYRPGRVRVAFRPNRSKNHSIRIYPQNWDWKDEGKSIPQIGNRLPIVKISNKDGLGEFEPHLNTIDRIIHEILQRLVIATFQAFRQRAAIGLPSVYPKGHPKAGEEINYEEIFTSDPGAFWQLPEGADMWESSQADLTPILNAVKNDILELAAASETPMSMFTPDAVNQSAEGASLAREGLVFKCRDRIKRIDPKVTQILELCFLWMGETEKADLDLLEVIWEDPDMPSMAERYDALVKSKGSVPWRTQMREILNFAPSAIDRMESERAADQLLAAAFATPAPAPQPVPQGQQNQPAQQNQGAVNDATSATTASPSSGAQ